jgi:maleamate amidohydrolase
MTERLWDKYLSEQDKEVFRLTGYGARSGYGTRTVILVIDVNYDFCGEKPEPITQSILKWRTSCGEGAWRGIEKIQKVLEAARAKNFPIIYTTAEPLKSRWHAGAWAYKSTRNSEAPPPERPSIDGTEIVHEIAPRSNELLIRKQKPSAFFGTALIPYLQLLKADGVIFMGTTTSGCVRASVIDAFSNNFHCVIVEDATFDRFEASHAINLFDLHAKYADVVTSDEVIDWVSKSPPWDNPIPS